MCPLSEDSFNEKLGSRFPAGVVSRFNSNESGKVENSDLQTLQ